MPATSAENPSADRSRSLKLHASAAECRTIETRAERAGLSVSAYLRAAALGRAVRARGASDTVETLSALDSALLALVAEVREAVSASGESAREKLTPVLDRVEAVRALMEAAAVRL